MALIDIIGISSIKIDWNALENEISPSSFRTLEIYPIPSSLGFKNDAIGICIPSSKGKDINEIKNELSIILTKLESYFELIELYDQQQISFRDVDILCKKFIG